jgi:hypothetical protein
MHVWLETVIEITHAQCRNANMLRVHKTGMQTLMRSIMLVGVNVNWSLKLPDLNDSLRVWKMFLKLSDISFYEDPFSCSRVTCK